jgi:hypothetical protein
MPITKVASTFSEAMSKGEEVGYDHSCFFGFLGRASGFAGDIFRLHSALAKLWSPHFVPQRLASQPLQLQLNSTAASSQELFSPVRVLSASQWGNFCG